METKTRIAETMETFYDQLESISKFKVNIQFNNDEDKNRSFNEVSFNNTLTLVDPNLLYSQNQNCKTENAK